MQSLKEIYNSHSGRLLNKWAHYIDIYEQYFATFRHKPISLLEFGIAHGGSLQLWRKYFGDQALITGIDINPECKKFEDANTRVITGSQEDKVFLEQLKSQIPKADILIDDGGHTMKQQITTFNMLFEHVNDGGLYICEDTHTSYWKEYYGGYKKKGTFIEFAKNFIDDIHGWHYKINGANHVTDITKNIWGIHFYDSVVIIEKKSRTAPENTFKGEKTLLHHFEDVGHKRSIIKSLKNKIQSK